MVLKRPPEAGEILQGTLDMLILRTLVMGPAHGHTIAQVIERTSENALEVEQGSLYPALHRLEDRGWLSSEWGVSENNRRAKFYRLTSKGRKELQRCDRPLAKDDARHRPHSRRIVRIKVGGEARDELAPLYHIEPGKTKTLPRRSNPTLPTKQDANAGARPLSGRSPATGTSAFRQSARDA